TGLLAALMALPLSAAIPASVQNEIVEFYNQSLDHYFISADAKEIQDLDSGLHAGWSRTGYRFPGIKIGSGQPATTPVCRFYGRPEAKIDSHFYSSKLSECSDVQVKFATAWQFEADEVFRAYAVDGNTGKCPVDTAPVYRLWNQRSDVNHRYTDQYSVYQQMVAKGYKPEGDGSPALPVAFCMPSGSSVVPPPAAGAPSCTLSTTTATPALGTTLLLTATCTGTPASYAWTGCTSTSSTCAASKSIAGAASYSVTATNASGSGAAVTMAVTWGGTTLPPPLSGPTPICTVSASTGTPTLGGAVSLTANCSQSPTRFDWYECSYLIQSLCNAIPSCPTNVNACTFSGSTTGLAHYAVAGTNAAGIGAKAGIDIDWGSGSGGGGGGGTLPTIPVCTALTSQSSPTVGSAIVLSASCTGNPTAYAWTGVACSSASCSTSSAAVGAQSYSVTATNALGASGPASVSVTWQPPGAPNCSISADNLSPTVGQSISITASCNGSPTSYAWTGCPSNGPVCTGTATVAGAKAYTVAATNVGGTSLPVSVTVNWAAAPTVVPGCSVVSSDSSPFVGQSITLTATCSSSPNPSGYKWTNCSSSQSTCSTSASSTGAVNYSVTASNVVGTSAPAAATVTWQQAVGGTDFCGAYNNVVYKSASTSGSFYTASGNGSFASNGVWVVSFVAGPGKSYGTAGTTDIAEYQGPAVARQVTLSKSLCDFRSVDPTGTNGPYTLGNGNSATVKWNIGAAPVGLIAGQTYYFNFRNWSPDLNGGQGGNSCSTSTCNAIITVNWPK
ncbi:MAG: hypothetical protein ABI039_13330, partial [Vicinamibacterales bacterium]